ncbi:MAG TPA: hypothetical protein VHV55_13515, partial [Pirellulales bacterium]|nr:hypothetical protein [Pirellulales bacterium]
MPLERDPVQLAVVIRGDGIAFAGRRFLGRLRLGAIRHRQFERGRSLLLGGLRAGGGLALLAFEPADERIRDFLRDAVAFERADRVLVPCRWRIHLHDGVAAAAELWIVGIERGGLVVGILRQVRPFEIFAHVGAHGLGGAKCPGVFLR